MYPRNKCVGVFECGVCVCLCESWRPHPRNILTGGAQITGPLGRWVCCILTLSTSRVVAVCQCQGPCGA